MIGSDLCLDGPMETFDEISMDFLFDRIESGIDRMYVPTVWYIL